MRSFQVVCPTCGIELRDVHASSTVKDFARGLERLQAQESSANFDSRTINYINTYVVPNSREDVLEFISLAAANIIPTALVGDYDAHYSRAATARRKAISEAWLAKMEQVYFKAEVTLSYKDLEQARILYENKMREIKRARVLHILLFGRDPGAMVVFGLPIILLVFLLVYAIITPILSSWSFVHVVLALIGLACAVYAVDEVLTRHAIRKVRSSIALGDYSAARIEADAIGRNIWSSILRFRFRERQRSALYEMIRIADEEHEL